MPLIFAPDADPSQPGVITSGTGLRPTTNGYANYKTLVPVNGGFGWTIPAVPLTMYGHNFSNTGRLIVGTASKLYQLGINTGPVYTVTDVSRGLGSYTGLGAVATDEGTPAYWDMCSVGQYVLATNKLEQRIQVQAAGAEFVDLAGSPNGSCITVFRNFVIVGNAGDYGAVTGTSDTVAWSAIGNFNSWTPSASTQANFQQLLDVPGRIVELRPLGDAVAVYKQNGIWLMRYTGNASLPFFFGLVNNTIGINAQYDKPSPLVDIGGSHIFVGRDDIYQFDGASAPRSITTGFVRDYLLRTFYSVARLQSTHVTHDMPNGEIYFWAYGLSYNYRLRKWGSLVAVTDTGVVAACESPSPSLLLATGEKIDNAEVMVAKANGRVYSRYMVPTDGSGQFYGPMVVNMEAGDNSQASTLTRVTPRFLTVPNGAGFLNYSRRNVAGEAAVSDDGIPAVWTADKRFDIVRDAFWHVNRMEWGSSAPFELIDMDFARKPSGTRR